jgi:hypothetical protein
MTKAGSNRNLPLIRVIFAAVLLQNGYSQIQGIPGIDLLLSGGWNEKSSPDFRFSGLRHINGT